MPSKNVIKCCQALIKKNWTISFVESASAGKLCNEFAAVINSGQILIGGLVCYHASMKEDLLLIPKGTIEQYTPESAIVTKLMAQNFHRFVNSDICVALTGLASPGGSESPSKPVGTIFLHIIFPDKEIAKRVKFDGNPEEIILQAVDAVADLVYKETNKKTK
ncbi:CinA family protein [Flavobacterium sp. N1736]|uniref:CinA family protein n=1 Tax=Flavobacterium sp. N1736 TaxID=2986823 RepID=UPI0022248D18|nr:CinA family protein [Flavobacterium sp. N1736]